jgi:hypothetical protein
VNLDKVDDTAVGQRLIRKPKRWLAKKADAGWRETWKQCVAVTSRIGNTLSMQMSILSGGKPKEKLKTVSCTVMAVCRMISM